MKAASNLWAKGMMKWDLFYKDYKDKIHRYFLRRERNILGARRRAAPTATRPRAWPATRLCACTDSFPHNQRLRLKVPLGEDAHCPSVADLWSTANWLEREVSRCPFIVVKTHKSDKFDRYLADIYYNNREKDPNTVAASGRYLNQEMLEKGIAGIWG